MEEERDVIVVEDENGEELSLEVIDYFLYDGVEYAVLVEAGANVEEDDVDAYMMQIQQDGDEEIFMPVDPEKFDEVSEAYLAMDDEEDEEEL